jgi:hypothetical protein
LMPAFILYFSCCFSAFGGHLLQAMHVMFPTFLAILGA